METFLHSAQSVAIILLLTITGYFCAKKGWLGVEAKEFLSKFIMRIASPSLAIYGLSNNLSKELLFSAGKYLLAAFLCMVPTGFLAFLFGRWIHLSRKSLCIFILMCALSNTMFVGYAMCQELFGEVCVPYVMFFYLVNTVLLQAVCIPAVRWTATGERFSLRSFINVLKMPTVAGVFIGIAIVLFGIRVPPLINSYLRYMNNVVSPLALLLTGYIIWEVGLKNFKLTKALGGVLVFRFLVAPALLLIFCRMMDITGLPRSVFSVMSAMPAPTLSVVAATEYGGDEKLAAQAVALTTLVCFFVIPLLMLFLT